MNEKVSGQAVLCTYCEHGYLKPCSSAQQRDKCDNWKHLQGLPTEPPKKAVPRYKPKKRVRT